jgi:hypothetical protein
MAGSAYSVTGAGLTLANQAVTLTWLNPIASPNLDFSFVGFGAGRALRRHMSETKGYN